MVESSSPFKDQFDFIQAFICWLKAFVARLVAERQVAESHVLSSSVSSRQTVVGKQHQVPQDEAERQLFEAKAAEADATKEFEERLAAHRASPDAEPLAIDVLVEEHGLDDCERRIALAALVPCLGKELAEAVFGELTGAVFACTLTVAALVAILDPEDIEKTVAYRRYFDHPEAKLIKAGLIVVDHHRGEVTPADLWDCDVALSDKAFRALTHLAGQRPEGETD